MNYKNIHHFLDNYQRDNVIFCYGNYAVFDMVSNLIESAKAVDIPIVLFALDEKIYNALTGICDIVNYFDGNINPDKFYEYGTQEYKKIVWQCWLIGNEILKRNKSYIYIDVDIVVRKNFEKDILSKFKNTDYDCIVQQTSRNSCCTGFFSLTPNKITIDLFTIDFLKKVKYLDYTDDQHFFNTIITKSGLLNIKLLSRDEYPDGIYYYEHYNRINYKCKIVHFNWIIGYKKKIDKMKIFNLWELSNGKIK